MCITIKNEALETDSEQNPNNSYREFKDRTREYSKGNISTQICIQRTTFNCVASKLLLQIIISAGSFSFN